MIERVVYTSRAADSIGSREVFDIVRTALNRNSQRGLTGGLIFLDGFFVQVLEGEPHVLHERMARISTDPRHERLEIRLREEDTQRRFPTEWMALRLPGEIDAGVLARFGYEPGLPAERFPGARLLDFVQACCSTLQEPA